MKPAAVIHRSFTIERRYAASPARVFAAWADVETKARWFIGPPEHWKLLRRELDLRVGGHELLHGQMLNGPETRFEARYHVIVPDQRLVYVYDMHHSGRHLSTSLATVEFEAAPGGGTRMSFTEQVAFLDGEDGARSRELGTAAHLDRLGVILADPAEVVSSRRFEAPRAQVVAAFTDPARLTTWWGPAGFTSRFEAFEARPGGAWRFVLRGPDGTEYPNECRFVELATGERSEPSARIVFDHLQAGHDFRMTMTFAPLGENATYVTWRLRFASSEEAERVRAAVEAGNEQNFDRLAAHLAARAP
jgi:uncharacterized protein YndB with AHSA1/START domain